MRITLLGILSQWMAVGWLINNQTNEKVPAEHSETIAFAKS